MYRSRRAPAEERRAIRREIDALIEAALPRTGLIVSVRQAYEWIYAERFPDYVRTRGERERPQAHDPRRNS